MLLCSLGFQRSARLILTTYAFNSTKNQRIWNHLNCNLGNRFGSPSLQSHPHRDTLTIIGNKSNHVNTISEKDLSRFFMMPAAHNPHELHEDDEGHDSCRKCRCRDVRKKPHLPYRIQKHYEENREHKRLGEGYHGRI